MTREAMELLRQELSRRSFMKRTVQAAGIGLFWDKFGERLFAQSSPSTTNPATVFSAIGNIVIPIDGDPGWRNFEPGITDYAMNVIVKQVLLGGNDLLYQGTIGTLVALNDTPPLIGFGTQTFLEMSESLQSQYFGNILSGQFESYGVQDVIFLAAFVGLFATRAVFFSNYPNHLATPGAEFQNRTSGGLKTGWDIMGFRGPVGADEEKRLRDRYANVTVFPGMDPANIYI
jgi:hypothetical protein